MNSWCISIRRFVLAGCIAAGILMVSVSAITPAPNMEETLTFPDPAGQMVIAPKSADGAVYVNQLGKGLYCHKDGAYTEVLKGRINSFDISFDGKQLIYSEDGSIKILELDSSRVQDVLCAGNGTNYYDVSWLPESRRILYACESPVTDAQANGKKIESNICMMNLDTGHTIKIAQGFGPSYVSGKDAVVFENREQGEILYKSLRDDSETVLGFGAEPSASPDGKHIAFTRSEFSSKLVENHIKVETGLQNIYIMDTSNFNDQQKITNNEPLVIINENEWLSKVRPSEQEQILSYSGVYCYRFPSWSGDSKSVYAMIRINHADDALKDEVKLIKINI